MKTVRLLATALTVVAATGLAAAPAMAYDTDAYSYAAGHMIHRSDIPKNLGKFKPALSFNAYGGRMVNTLCDVPQADPTTPDSWVKYPVGMFTFDASYNATGPDAPSIQVSVNQYASTQKAIAAFGVLSKNIKKCTGTGSNNWTGDDGNVYTYSTQVTHGVVPEVTTAGVQSLFVSNNSLSQSTPGDSKFVNDQYTVFSLFDDTIIATAYFGNTNVNLTSAQRKSVNQVAFNAETRWLS